MARAAAELERLGQGRDRRLSGALRGLAVRVRARLRLTLLLEALLLPPLAAFASLASPKPAHAEQFYATQVIGRVPPLDVGMRVEEVVLFRSHLGGCPARYEAVERFALQSTSRD